MSEKLNNKNYKFINNENNNVDMEENDDNIIINAFSHFDINNNGKINVEGIKKALTSFGDIMTEEEIDNIFKSFDLSIDNNGLIDYVDLINILKNNNIYKV